MHIDLQDKALDIDIPSEQASFLLAVIGIANTIGRVVLGYISDKPWLNRLWLYNASLTICGLGKHYGFISWQQLLLFHLLFIVPNSYCL